MSYSNHLRKLFPGLKLNPEDLLLLESFQIKYLPDRVPKKEFAALLRANPLIHRYFVAKYPPIEEFIDEVFTEIKPITGRTTIEAYCQELLWEIAELIVYNKYPEVYDSQVHLNWKLNQITTEVSLKGKIVIDAGAGTGRLAFLVAPFAKTVFAIEPISSFRKFIRDKVAKENIGNIYVMDGFLDLLPLPDNSTDFLMTSNAIGWNLKAELMEIERVLISGGQAIHLMKSNDPNDENPLHNTLTSPEWNYSLTNYTDESGLRLKYSKTISKE